MTDSYDLIFAGAGLANSLAAIRILQRHPHARIKLLENGPNWGSDHTWCLHQADLDEPMGNHWIAPLLSKTWPSYDVIFPSYRRTIHHPYGAISSHQARKIVTATLGKRIAFDTHVQEISTNKVRTANGQTYHAKHVIDGRGQHALPKGPMAFQKFFGLMVKTKDPHQLQFPVLMDTEVDQKQGFRFFYLLPFDCHRILVEDTRFETSHRMDVSSYQEEVVSYCHQLGWEIEATLYQERGVLPLPTRGFSMPTRRVAASGMLAGHFHVTTGYSLGSAIKFAEFLAEHFYDPQLRSRILTYSQSHWRRQRFFRRLNNMFFYIEPAAGLPIMQKFYRLNASTIGRFYSGKLTFGDKVRILSGQPPVPILAGLREFFRAREATA